MTHMRSRTLAIGLSGCCAVLAAGPLSPAQASNAGINQVMETAIPKIGAEEQKFINALPEFEKTGDPSSVEAALNSNIKLVRSVRSEVAKQRAEGKRGKKGKAKIKRAFQRIIRAYRNLKVAFGVVHANPKKALKQARKALVADKKADRELEEARALLK